MLDWLRGKERSGARALADEGDLFDEEFQRRLEVLAIVSRKLVAGRTRAERRSRKTGSGIEFADHRQYAPGDDFRYLDWNLYARLDRPYVRVTRREAGEHFRIDRFLAQFPAPVHRSGVHDDRIRF